MAAATSTTIRDVSILSKKNTRRDPFELVLSRECIEIHRPERAVQRMSWDRVTEWEIEERNGYVLLVLRGHGATTPLVVPGWTLDDLEVVMRDVTAGEPGGPEPAAVDADDVRSSATVAVAATVAPAPPASTAPAHGTSEPDPNPAPAVDEAEAAGAAATLTRAARRKSATRRTGRPRRSLRVVVTVVLLGLLATAVLLVLLQSAGVIDWSFLGPVA